MTCLMRVLALAILMLFGAAGAATAQTTTYNFIFSAANGAGSGFVTINNATKQVVSIQNFFVDSVQQFLDTSGKAAVTGYGTNPTLFSTTAPQLFSAPQALTLTVSTQPGSNVDHAGYLFYRQGSADVLYAAGTTQTLTETFNAIPAPVPGGGRLSWIAAALLLAAVGAWRLFDGRREPYAPADAFAPSQVDLRSRFGPCAAVAA